MLKDQKGLSLVELIVVVAMIGILSVGTITSLYSISSNNMKGCVQSIYNYLGKTKTQSMAKGNATMTLYVNAHDEIYVGIKFTPAGSTEVVENDYKIGKSSLRAAYVTTNGNTVVIDNTNKLVISFDGSTGALLPIAGGTNNYVEKITVYNGTDTSSTDNRSIVIIPETGKYYIE